MASFQRKRAVAANLAVGRRPYSSRLPNVPSAFNR